MFFPLLAIYFVLVFFTKTPPGGQILLVPRLSLEPEHGHTCDYGRTAVSQMPLINISLVFYNEKLYRLEVGKAVGGGCVLVSLIRTLSVQKYLF